MKIVINHSSMQPIYEQITDPVSYTHLDVYKRQPLMRLPKK